MSFQVATILFAVLLAAAAAVSGYGTTRWPDLHKRLPREKIIGEVIGCFCLLWAAHHVCGMLEGPLVRYHTIIKLFVPVVAALSYFYLDYLFTRALGGLLLLSVNHLLHEAFVVELPGRPIFSILCYTIGITGMFLVAYPWQLRDLLEKTTTSDRWRRGATAGFGALSAAFVVFLVLSR